jgi:uncharacterized SAM-binding protein YcdF (DUF218 family)
MRELIDTLLSPLGFGLLLGALMWLARGRLARAVIIVGLALELACLLFATPFGANLLLGAQEQREAVTSACESRPPSTLVLLAGGMRRDSGDAGDAGALGESSLQRTLGAADLFARVPGAQLVISGGRHRDAIVSEEMARFAARLGVPVAAIRIEGRSLTTWENAMRVRELEPPLPQRIWLVTSAVHLPRALLAFRAAGFLPCGFPVDRRAAMFAGWTDLLPGGAAIARSEAVLHEWIGELAYRWRAKPPGG